MRSRIWRLFTIVLLITAAGELCHCDESTEDAEEPACKVEPTNLDFDTLTVGTPAIRDIIITNVGGGRLARTVADTCDVFAIVGGAASYDLQAGESYTITVRFQPNAVGAFACTLDVGTPLCTVVPCQGVGRPVVGSP
jgi:hypothetical protein